MRTRELAAAVIVALAAVTAAWSHSKPLTGPEMVYGSKYVVVATVVDRTVARVGAAGLIVTRYRLAVEKGLRGNPPRELTIEVVGGTMDGETQSSCLSVPLSIGTRYALFVNDPEHPGFSTFTGAQQGVVADPGQAEGRAVPLQTLSGPMAEIAQGKALSFGELVERLGVYIAGVEKLPAPPAPARAVYDPPLPAKRFVTLSEATAFAPMPVKPLDEPESPGPVRPEHAEVIERDASYVTEVKRPADAPQSWAAGPVANRFIVWNELPYWMTPWSPRDQAMMSRWNYYGDIHRISGAPTGTWSWGNGVFDMTGFPSNADMTSAFGRAWNTNELAVCFSRANASGVLVEADIAVNPAVSWTLNNELGTRHDDATPWGFDQSVLHELGHSWGLHHPWEWQNVTWDSVMNYSPKECRFPTLFADDAYAIRASYPGIAVHDGQVSFYRTQDDPSSQNAAYVRTDPSPQVVRQTDPMNLNAAFKIENSGTDNIVSPQVDIYLTHNRMSWSAYELLASLHYVSTVVPNSIHTLTTGLVTVPFSTPPGDYYVALWLNDAADARTYNNEAWNFYEWGRMTILSYPWTIYTLTSWQFQQVRTGPNGAYDFWFFADAGDRVDISTCDADGGYATYDSVLELDGPNGLLVDFSDDACGLQSRISYLVQTTGNHHLILDGYAGAFGTTRMQYRGRSFGGTNLHLTASAQKVAGTVTLDWGGDTGPYDLVRSTTPWFANPVFVQSGTLGTTYQDPVLNNGVTYYYRSR
jgi:hypothetical protein